MAMRVLVTGGAGFIGSHYVRSLLDQEDDPPRVTVLDKFTYAGNLANLAGHLNRCDVIEGDIRDGELLHSLLPGHDLVVNFAGETHVDRSIRSGQEFVLSNTTGVETLARACLDTGTPRLVQVSTDEVYGSISEGSWDETTPLSPNSPYAAAKAGGDFLALSYARTHGLDVRVTRCSNNYGPYQFPEKLIPRFVTNLLEGERLPLYGSGTNVREWVHVDDHCRGIQLVAEHGEPGEVYHISGDDTLSNLEVVEMLLELCGADWNSVDRVEDRKGHDLRYALNDNRLRELGYRPRIGFREGLSETVRWYVDNPAWWKPLRQLI